MNQTQQSTAVAIADILYQMSGVAIDDQNSSSSFIELGYDSLFLIQFSAKLKKSLGLKVTFRQMLSEVSTFNLLLEHVAPDESTVVEQNTIAPQVQAAHVQESPVPASLQPATPVQAAPGVSTQTAQSTSSPSSATSVASQYTCDAQQAQSLNNPQSSGQNSSANGLNNHGSAIQALISKQLDIMSLQLTEFSKRSNEPNVFIPGLRPEQPQPLAANETPIVQPAPTQSQISTGLAVSNDKLAANSTTSGSKRENNAKIQPFGAIARISKAETQPLSDQQITWLADFTRKYNTRTEKSKEFTERFREVHADPRVVSGFKPALKELIYPIVAKRSNGCRIWDQDDNEYIDALNGFGSNYFGYANPDITQAVVDQLWQGAEIGPQNPLTGQAAALICEFTGMERVGFCNTGSEAVMGAMRIARTVTGKDLIVIFSGSYHGIFDEVLVRATPSLMSIPAAPGITDESVQNVLVLEYGSDESLDIINSRIDEIAAIMVEPVQSRRPQFQPREFLTALRTITAKNDIPYIFDEVITGFRSAPGGAQEYFGIKADIATYGKVVGGGMQIGIVAGRKKYMDALDGGSWQFGDQSEPEEAVTYFAGTFVRHPASIAACLSALTILKKGGPQLQENTNRLTSELAKKLNTFFIDNDIAIEVNHFSSLWRMEYLEPMALGELLFYLIRLKGIHIYPGFPCFITLKHTEQDVQDIFNAITESAIELQEVGFISSKKKKMSLRVAR